ncbi:hypothetical protein FHU29_000766 [Hoyosella altamirensis]|uniref:Uncharacterized protein n=1 Tax=Hoyosella altamirensis TaxID=616997 RepID=A0A839RHT3_9ACTN|nr:hypothetical protein [Hoyosella altamirensis]
MSLQVLFWSAMRHNSMVPGAARPAEHQGDRVNRSSSARLQSRTNSRAGAHRNQAPRHAGAEPVRGTHRWCIHGNPQCE